jgi:Peptidase family M28
VRPAAALSVPVRLATSVVVVAACLTACSGSDDPTEDGAAEGDLSPPVSSPSVATESLSDPTPTTPTTQIESTTPPPRPATFQLAWVLRTVRTLALRFGPREAASPAYAEAADWVEQRFDAYGYNVRRQPVHVPAGNSWGVDVDSGTTTNVVATRPGFDPTEPHLVVSAHLDTVPQAPGAEDDASGIGVLLELARMSAQDETRLPVVFVAFGGEEPRGDGDALHHFGSRAMVARMPADQRAAVAGMVSMDRVGVGAVVPVCTAGNPPPTVRGQLVRAGVRTGVPTLACVNASSDHESFDEAGMPAARVGGTSYAGYHSAADLPAVINPPQLRRVGVLMWTWLTGP